jgi:uncharacterized membrane protein
MDNRKKVGIALIVIGVALPLVFLFFTTGYQQATGFFNTLFALKVPVNLFNKYKFGIPYRLFIAFGVALIFLGIRSLDFAKFNSGKSDKDGDSK